jgi:hypothetical protein
MPKVIGCTNENLPYAVVVLCVTEVHIVSPLQRTGIFPIYNKSITTLVDLNHLLQGDSSNGARGKTQHPLEAI